MTAISARDIFQSPRGAVWNLPTGLHVVTYEDGMVVENTRKHLIFNRYCWELFTLFPSTPIVSTCDARSIIKTDFYNADTHIRLLETIYQHICHHNGLEAYTTKEPLLRKVYEIIDLIHNEIVMNAAPNVSTIDAMDFIAVTKDPMIVTARETMHNTPEGVDRSYKQIRNFIATTPNKNRFVDAYRSKAINDNQANQCIGPRGFVTGLDRTVFKQPITSGFIRGMSNLYEIMAESTTAAKSLNANNTHIETSEYTSRRIQVLTMVVQRVFNGDCGSQEYMDIFVTPSVLENLKGKYYLLPDGKLGNIKGDEEHLCNQIIKMRSVLGCKHPVNSSICVVCLGKLSQNFKENSNLGYTFSAYLMEKVTQAILSTKHLTHSVRKSTIKLEGTANKYFYTTEDGDLLFHPDINLQGVMMVLPNAKLNKLVDVLSLPHTNIGLAKIGELDEIIIKDLKHKTPTTERLHIAYRDRNCVLTRTLLEHIKSVDLEADARGNFVVPMDKFDKTLPVFNNPLKETNIVSFVNRIAAIIETNKDKATLPQDKLNLLFSTVTDKFKCNISVIEVLVYATTTYNALNKNFKLGRNTQQPYSEGKYGLFRHRDFAALAVFEEQITEIISNPATAFTNVHRQEHPMAILFTPQNIIKS